MTRPEQPQQVKERIIKVAQAYVTGERELPVPEKMKNIRGAVRGNMGVAVDSIRKLAIGWLFRSSEREIIARRSTNGLTDAQVMGLHDWIGAEDVGGQWLPADGWDQEYRWLCWQAEADYNAQLGIIQSDLPLVAEGIALGGIITEVGPITAVPTATDEAAEKLETIEHVEDLKLGSSTYPVYTFEE